MSLATRRFGAAAALLVAACVLCTAPAWAQNETSGTGMVKTKSAFRWIRPPPARPPPFRRPPPAQVPYVHKVEYTELQILCPQIIDPVTKYPMDDPACNVPRATVAAGEEALTIRDENGLLNGDLLNVTLEEVDTPENPSRRRLRSIIREEQRTGRVLLATSAELPTPAFRLKSLKSILKGSQKEIYSGTPIDLRTIVYIMDFSSCKLAGWSAPATLTPEKVTSDMLRSASAPANNLANYYGACSYEKTLFNPNNFLVLGPVPVPCIGGVTPPPRPPRPPRPPPRAGSTISSLSRRNDTYDDWWDLSKYCTASEQQAWERAAEAYAQAIVAQDPNSATGKKLQGILQWRERRRNIYILPPGVKCSWSGYADVTCTSATCSAYVRGYSDTNAMQVIMHEAMHNYGLEHAGRGTLEYGDATDVMGDFNKAGKGLLCPNAPNMYRIGWAKPINEPGVAPFQTATTGAWGNLTVANFTNTNWIRGLVIPAQGTRDDNMIVVNVGAESTQIGAAKATGAQAYYFSYRIKNTTAGGYDSGLTSDFHKKVLVHAYNGIQSERVFGFKSNLLDWGPNFQSRSNTWTSPFLAVTNDLGGGVRLVVQSTSDTQAVVDICRITENGKELSCDDGIDNDCDGLQDTEDPDCQ
uniref:Gametolysin n=1 Tax=Chlamydomonas reinhardtii TaxID=3055 RepID=Q93WN9_CHLRE|nr:gametolysin [Chlamydomonas reinhardtii]BAB68384.1 gametolysin [Chlamydomonas reinhardtii]